MDCAICLEGAWIESIRLGCEHIFHTTCLAKWSQLSNTCPMCRCIIMTPKCMESSLFKAKVLSKSRCFESACAKIDKAETRKQEFILNASKRTQSWTYEEREKFLKVTMNNANLEIKVASHEIVYDFLISMHRFEHDKALHILDLFIKKKPFLSKIRLFRAILLQKIGKFDQSVKDLNIILRREPKNKIVIKMKKSTQRKLLQIITENRKSNNIFQKKTTKWTF